MAAGSCNPGKLQYNKIRFCIQGDFMKEMGNWLRALAAKMQAGLYRFAAGRYGTDRLNVVILCVGVAASILSALMPKLWIGKVLWVASYALMIWAICRSLSRNINKRYQENRRFLLMIDRIKDRKNRYFICPRCRQTVRVPRGKGKIMITCPKCKEKFQRKT